MDSKHEIFRLLKENRAELVRRRKHEVYRLPNGNIFVTGLTQTDDRGWRNRLAQLRKLLGVAPPDKRAAPSRRTLGARNKEKVDTAIIFARLETPTEMRSLADQLEKALVNSYTLGTRRR